jgi:uncharacterized membrane protein
MKKEIYLILGAFIVWSAVCFFLGSKTGPARTATTIVHDTTTVSYTSEQKDSIRMELTKETSAIIKGYEMKIRHLGSAGAETTETFTQDTLSIQALLKMVSVLQTRLDGYVEKESKTTEQEAPARQEANNYLRFKVSAMSTIQNEPKISAGGGFLVLNHLGAEYFFQPKDKEHRVSLGWTF